MNILLTSVGRRGYLVRYFREALHGAGKIIATNTLPDTPGMYAADEAIVVPASHDPSYVNVIEDICQLHHIGIICSLHDLDTFVLSQHRDRLSRTGAIPVLPNPEWAKICLDKYECGQILEQYGFRPPWACIDLNQAETAVAEGRVQFPLIVKARFGFGSFGLHTCRNLIELKTWHRQVATEIVGSAIQQFCPLPEALSVLIQQAVVGPEFCVDVVNDLHGHYAAHFGCHVYSMRAGESDSAITVDVGMAGDLPLKLSRLTQHCGIWGIDVIVDNGIPKVIDINPRFTGDYPFQHIAGANIPACLVAWARGEEPEYHWLHPEVGVRGYKDLAPTRSAGIVAPVSQTKPTEDSLILSVPG
jgi:carbamoyl-phosphate synthase large subunit